MLGHMHSSIEVLTQSKNWRMLVEFWRISAISTEILPNSLAAHSAKIPLLNSALSSTFTPLNLPLNPQFNSPFNPDGNSTIKFDGHSGLNSTVKSAINSGVKFQQKIRL